MSQSSISSFSQSTNSSSTRDFDPLVALHDHRLEEHPELDSSILSDDEMIDLLKKAKDPKELAYLNMEISKQSLNSDGSSTLSFDAPSGLDSQAYHSTLSIH
ncbi:hypothetical protein CBS101457_001208 [Exobasidium rhododendri]|nr:hypothetical protein CBS101457_001208 [Exobasidium rhododendri]